MVSRGGTGGFDEIRAPPPGRYLGPMSPPEYILEERSVDTSAPAPAPAPALQCPCPCPAVPLPLHLLSRRPRQTHQTSPNLTKPHEPLPASLSTQALWHSTAGRRPQQPEDEREAIEKMYAQNFAKVVLCGGACMVGACMALLCGGGVRGVDRTPPSTPSTLSHTRARTLPPPERDDIRRGFGR